MSISVKYIDTETPISVNIDGLCNHADSSFEEEVQDNYNAIHEYTGSTPYTVETCNKCGSFRTVFEDDTTEWEGVGAMPLTGEYDSDFPYPHQDDPRINDIPSEGEINADF